MFYCGKKIFYLALYEQGQKNGQVGFAEIYTGKGEVRITLQIRKRSTDDQGEPLSGSYPLYLGAGTKVHLGNIRLINGIGSFERTFTIKQKKIAIENFNFAPEEITGILVKLDEGGECQIKGGDIVIEKETFGKSTAYQMEPEEPLSGNRETENKTLEEQPKEDIPEVQTAELELEQTATDFQEMLSENKWEELLKHFRQIHPFGDERVFICIEPKDFIILQEKYQKLVNNSFLLHGFYNYRYLILGEDSQLGEQGKTCFYLGVPGVFYEREKMVAVMFGFEGFASEGAIEIGKFGYYMRRVEL